MSRLSARDVLALAAAAAALLCAASVDAGVLYAKPAATGAGDCSSWVDGCTLQKALTGASAGDEIWVMQGTHSPGSSRTDTFRLVSGVAVYGGFAGTETALAQRDPAINVTILSGDVNGDDGPDFANNDENNYHVVTASETDGSAVLDGVSVKGGNASGDEDLDQYGGGMFNVNSSPTVTNVTFASNLAFYRGGGMYNSASSPVLNNVTFSVNRTYYKGGGMCNYRGSNPTLTNVTLTGNVGSWGGGGMYNSTSSPVLNNVTFSGNVAAHGGGMWNDTVSPRPGDGTPPGNGVWSGDRSNPVLTNVILWGDHAELGPEIFNTDSEATVTDSVIDGGCRYGSNCTNIITGDPMLGALADNGGSTRTHGLQPGSSAIDAGGVNSSCAPTDQRGVTRPQGAGCDIGAYEATPGSLAEVDLTIPASALVAGQGTTWVSVTDVYNPTPDPVDLDVLFVPRADQGGEPARRTVTVPSGSSYEYTNTLQDWFGLSAGVGATLIDVLNKPAADVLVTSQVEAHNRDGSIFGQYFPATRTPITGEALFATTTDSLSDRVNAGFAATAYHTSFCVSLEQPAHTVLGERCYTGWPAGHNEQLTDIFASLGVAPRDAAVLRVSVSSGGLSAYGSDVDNATNDPTTRLPMAVADELVLPILGSVRGMGIEFRSSTQLVNTGAAQVVELDYYDRGGLPGVTSTTNLSVAAGESFSLPVEGLGSVVLRGSGLAADGRFYSVLESGTAGQGIPGLTDPLVADETYHVLGLHRGPGKVRANYITFNPGPDVAHEHLAAYDGATHTLEGELDVTVPAGELVQLNAFLPETDHANKRLEITTDAPVYVLVSQVNASDDPATRIPLFKSPWTPPTP